jgi:hypothetical protein
MLPIYIPTPVITLSLVWPNGSTHPANVTSSSSNSVALRLATPPCRHKAERTRKFHRFRVGLGCLCQPIGDFFWHLDPAGCNLRLPLPLTRLQLNHEAAGATDGAAERFSHRIRNPRLQRLRDAGPRYCTVWHGGRARGQRRRRPAPRRAPPTLACAPRNPPPPIPPPWNPTSPPCIPPLQCVPPPGGHCERG